MADRAAVAAGDRRFRVTTLTSKSGTSRGWQVNNLDKVRPRLRRLFTEIFNLARIRAHHRLHHTCGSQLAPGKTGGVFPGARGPCYRFSHA